MKTTMQELRTKLYSIVEREVAKGFFLRDFWQRHAAMQAQQQASGQYEYLNPFRDNRGGCCLVGMVAGDAVEADEETSLGMAARASAKRKLGLTTEELDALEAGFENNRGFPTVRTLPRLFRLGAEVRATYTETTPHNEARGALPEARFVPGCERLRKSA